MLYKILHISGHLLVDFAQPLSYLPIGLLTGLILTLILELIFRIIRKHWFTDGFKKTFLLFITLSYLTVVLILTLFSREAGSRTSIDLMPFSTWGGSARDHLYFLENIVLFIPFGMLLPLCFNWFKEKKHCIWTGFAFSVFLELFQLITETGYCQLDDVMTNTFGAFLGWLLFRMIQNYRAGHTDYTVHKNGEKSNVG